MKRMTRFQIISFAAAVVVSSALAAAPGETRDARAEGAAAEATQTLRVQPWHLLQRDGAELYRELCASCHGVDGAGYGPTAGALKVAPTDLTHLRRTGVPKEHWTYVILAACEDHHHWATDGSETMPCWQRLFRQALGHPAASLLVSKKLTDYLDTIQQ